MQVAPWIQNQIGPDTRNWWDLSDDINLGYVTEEEKAQTAAWERGEPLYEVPVSIDPDNPVVMIVPP